MAIQSLQKIILLEGELYAAEQVAQEKSLHWYAQQQEEIQTKYEKQLAALEEKIKAAKTLAEKDAQKKAAIAREQSLAKASRINTISEASLRKYIEDNLRSLIGLSP